MCGVCLLSTICVLYMLRVFQALKIKILSFTLSYEIEE